VEDIVTHLKQLRQAGIPLGVSLIRGYMVGVIQHRAPHLLAPSPAGSIKFSCSNAYTRQFLHSQLGWSPRRATRAAQKIPQDANNLLRRAFLRMACAIRDEGIPACCIVNADQTQVVYSSGSKSSWAPTGDRQVSVVGTEEKRAFTLMVAIALSGDVLPLQAIYSGKTVRSLPDSKAPGMDDARQHGLLLDFSGNDHYWATQASMRNWVMCSVVPFFNDMRERHGLPATQRCILQIDLWAVHRSLEFRTWMAKMYPWITIHYIPGGCTGLFQACDLLVNRALKLAIQQASHADVVQETLRALEFGTAPKDVRLDTTVKTLRNRSVRWIVAGHKAISDVDLVQKVMCMHNFDEVSLTEFYARLLRSAKSQKQNSTFRTPA
jgi:hypothetical protein